MDQFYEVRDEEVENLLKDIGSQMKRVCRMHGYSFMLMLFQINGPNLFYISDADREDVIKALKEFITKYEAKQQ